MTISNREQVVIHPMASMRVLAVAGSGKPRWRRIQHLVQGATLHHMPFES
jgi:hypothetical protein